MGEAHVKRIFERLDGIGERLSRLEGICASRTVCPVQVVAAKPSAGESRESSAPSERKWLQWLVGSLITIIGTLVGALCK